MLAHPRIHQGLGVPERKCLAYVCPYLRCRACFTGILACLGDHDARFIRWMTRLIAS
ncbi:MAG: hypothetical protein M3442_17950 [Chloroflexota bacterium]|nr:hypothetical protein [Chloroflexota bacterium]